MTQQIDLSGVVGRMVASVMFGLAEIELEYRRERQAAGIQVAKKAGVYRGRQKGTTKAIRGIYRYGEIFVGSGIESRLACGLQQLFPVASQVTLRIDMAV